MHRPSDVVHKTDATIQIGLKDALAMAMRNLLFCETDELEDLINTNSAVLADEPNGTYAVWPGKAGEYPGRKGSKVTP